MIIYPAIDIKNGKCVRLLQGKADAETIYGENPVEVAKKWEDMGARFLHVVDLDGAFSGDSLNMDIIKKSQEVLPYQFRWGAEFAPWKK